MFTKVPVPVPVRNKADRPSSDAREQKMANNSRRGEARKSIWSTADTTKAVKRLSQRFSKTIRRKKDALSIKSKRSKTQQASHQETALGNQHTPYNSTRGQKLKDQLLHYFRSTDSVVDTWAGSNARSHDHETSKRKKNNNRPLSIPSSKNGLHHHVPEEVYGAESRPPDRQPRGSEDGRMSNPMP